jgi:Domain of unknown function (DUF5615)
MADDVSLYVSPYLDEDVTNQLAGLKQQRGLEVVSAVDAGMIEVVDDAHLAYAAERGMTLMTYNERDYIMNWQW